MDVRRYRDCQSEKEAFILCRFRAMYVVCSKSYIPNHITIYDVLIIKNVY